MNFSDQIQLLTCFIYGLLISSILLVTFAQPLRTLLKYGKNLQVSGNKSSNQFVNFVAVKFVVPKQWFTHFYICLFSLATASFFYPCHENTIKPASAAFKNIKIIQILLWLQGGRRLIESYAVTKFSPKSTMNFSHYIVGMAHYILISTATYFGLWESCSASTALTTTDYILIFVYGVAVVQQFKVHNYLANLRKYSLPQFKIVASPHYFWEIVIYTVLFTFSVKERVNMISASFLAALAFVSVNLSITSLETYKFYVQKYGHDFKLRWAILPGIL